MQIRLLITNQRGDTAPLRRSNVNQVVLSRVAMKMKKRVRRKKNVKKKIKMTTMRRKICPQTNHKMERTARSLNNDAGKGGTRRGLHHSSNA